MILRSSSHAFPIYIYIYIQVHLLLMMIIIIFNIIILDWPFHSMWHQKMASIRWLVCVCGPNARPFSQPKTIEIYHKLFLLYFFCASQKLTMIDSQALQGAAARRRWWWFMPLHHMRDANIIHVNVNIIVKDHFCHCYNYCSYTTDWLMAMMAAVLAMAREHMSQSH